MTSFVTYSSLFRYCYRSDQSCVRAAVALRVIEPPRFGSRRRVSAIFARSQPYLTTTSIEQVWNAGAVVTVERPTTTPRIPGESTHLCRPLLSPNKAVNHSLRLPFYNQLSINVEGSFRGSISTWCPSTTESIHL